MLAEWILKIGLTDFQNSFTDRLSSKFTTKKQLLKNIHPIMLATFCSLAKRSFRPTAATQKNRQNDLKYEHPINQEERRRDKRSAFSFSHSQHHSASNIIGWRYISLTLVLSITESRLLRSTFHSVMLSQQFLHPTLHTQISSEFFIFQHDSAPVHRALEAINFLHIFAKCWAILKILSKQIKQ